MRFVSSCAFPFAGLKSHPFHTDKFPDCPVSQSRFCQVPHLQSHKGGQNLAEPSPILATDTHRELKSINGWFTQVIKSMFSYSFLVSPHVDSLVIFIQYNIVSFQTSHHRFLLQRNDGHVNSSVGNANNRDNTILCISKKSCLCYFTVELFILRGHFQQ